MGWNAHPDTMCMARANAVARNESGETGTLAYLRAYRSAYAKLVEQNPWQGGDQYLAGLDKVIHQWELGTPPTSGRRIVPL